MRKKKNRFLFGTYVLVVIINVLSWSSRSFGDRVRQSVFCVTQYIQGHISDLFPFSVGEFLLILAVLLVAGALILVVLFLIRQVYRVLKKEENNVERALEEAEGSKKSTKFIWYTSRYFYTLLWITGIVGVIMSINCFSLYHCSSFQENYMSGNRREYTVKELAIVRDYVVKQCNELAVVMERDENGYILYREDIGQRAVSEMKRMGKKYPLLDGYYPVPKKLTFSGFFS